VFRGEPEQLFLPHIIPEPGRHLGHRQHPIDHTGVDGGKRHRIMFRLGGILRDGQPAPLLDSLYAQGSITVRARQNNRGRMRTVSVRQRAKEPVHGIAPAAFGRDIVQTQAPLRRHQMFARGYHIHVIQLHLLPILGLQDWELGFPRQDFGEQGFMRRRQVDDDHKHHPAVGRHRLEKLLEHVQASGRAANPHHGLPLVLLSRQNVIHLIIRRHLGKIRRDIRPATL
jgi:hypothetical protein